MVVYSVHREKLNMLKLRKMRLRKLCTSIFSISVCVGTGGVCAERKVSPPILYVCSKYVLTGFWG